MIDSISTPKRRKRKKTVKAWASIGSHNNIFVFGGGPVADKYPYLMHIFAAKISTDLIPVTISYEVKE
jgi:hypothetical protein